MLDLWCRHFRSSVSIYYIYNTLTALNSNGNDLTILREYKQAIECYDNSLEIDPNDADIWKKKGNCLSRLGIEKAAQECFDKAKMLESSKIGR